MCVSSLWTVISGKMLLPDVLSGIPSFWRKFSTLRVVHRRMQDGYANVPILETPTRIHSLTSSQKALHKSLHLIMKTCCVVVLFHKYSYCEGDVGNIKTLQCRNQHDIKNTNGKIITQIQNKEEILYFIMNLKKFIACPKRCPTHKRVGVYITVIPRRCWDATSLWGSGRLAASMDNRSGTLCGPERNQTNVYASWISSLFKSDHGNITCGCNLLLFIVAQLTNVCI